MKKFLFLLSTTLLLLGNSLYAHDLTILANNINMTGSGNTVIFSASTWLWYDEWSLSDPATMDGLLSVFQAQFHMSYNQNTCSLNIVDVSKNPERSWLTDVDGLFTCEADVENIEDIKIQSILFKDISEDPVDTFVTITLGEDTRKFVFSSTDTEETIDYAIGEKENTNSLEMNYPKGIYFIKTKDGIMQKVVVE